MRATLHTARTADGSTLAFDVDGRPDEATLVLLHSLGADNQMWDESRKRMPPGWRVLAPDTRGHGASSSNGPTSVGRWVDDLAVVLDAAAVERAVLVGVSMGGIQALAFAATRPERVDALVVADSFARLDPAVAQAKITQLAGQSQREPMEDVARTYLADTFDEPYPTGAHAVRRALAGMEPTAYRDAVTATFSADVTDCLPQVSAPALVLWGDRDAKTPRPLSEAIADRVPTAELQTIPEAGHLSSVDNPAEFVSRLRDFLGRVKHRQAPTPSSGGH